MMTTSRDEDAARQLQSSSLMSTSSATTPTASVSNWRLIPKDADEYKKYLVERPTWSPDQYKDSLELYERLTSCKDSYVSPAIQSALNTLDHAYRLYGPSSVICSFNGGKDAVVILHLVRAIHAKYYNSTGETPIRPRSVYFNNDNEFSEVTSFLEESVNAYDLDMVAFESGVGFAAGLDILVKNNYIQGSAVNVLPMAFVLGTRESDPNAMGQDSFCPSSHWMPPFMRVNPVLNWNYGLVWHFLRLFKLPYCSLYDEGYTSLGTTKDTHPCPALEVNRGDDHDINQDGDSTVGIVSSNLPKFWPAYMLVDWDQERAGRVKKEKAADSKNSSTTTKKHFPRTNSGLTTVSDERAEKAAIKNAEVGSDNNATQDDGTVQTLGTDDLNNYGGEAKTVGIVVVGDEILKGMTTDTNTQTAARALRKECLQLSRVVVVSDDVHEITKEIRRLRNEVDVVITSGGVGPTHDDVTIKGVAEALNRELVYNEEMAKLLQKKMNADGSGTETKELTSAQIKMATLPSNAKLRYLSTDEWPVLQCRNVFILPGVPEFFAKKIENVATYLSSQLERSIVYKIVLSVDEQSIVDILNDAVKNHPKVSMGSYPFVSHPDFKTVVTLEADLVDSSTHQFNNTSGDEGAPGSRNSLFLGHDAVILSKEVRDRNVRLALDDLISALPQGSILRVENDDLDPFMM
jgi:FAD synthetase